MSMLKAHIQPTTLPSLNNNTKPEPRQISKTLSGMSPTTHDSSQELSEDSLGTGWQNGDYSLLGPWGHGEQHF